MMIGKTFWIRHRAHSSGAFTRNEGYRNCYHKSANKHTGSPLSPHLGIYRYLYIHITKAIVCYDSTHHNAVSTVFPSITIFLKAQKSTPKGLMAMVSSICLRKLVTLRLIVMVNVSSPVFLLRYIWGWDGLILTYGKRPFESTHYPCLKPCIEDIYGDC